MSFGTPEDNARAKAQEHDNSIPLDYVGHSKLDMHAAAEDITARAVRAEEVIDSYRALDSELALRGLKAEALHKGREAAVAVRDFTVQACWLYVSAMADANGLAMICIPEAAV